MNTDNKKFTAKHITMIGMFGAISAVLMLLEFPVPLAPAFIKMDFSDLPVILGGYMMGPVAGLIIIIIKIVLNFAFNGTITAGVGELANFIYSVAYMLPAVLIYKSAKSKKVAAISLATGTIIVSAFAVIVNMFFTFPVYAKLLGMDMDAIVSMGSSVNPFVKDEFSLMLFSIFPFNIFKYSVVSILTFYLYKRTKSLLKI